MTVATGIDWKARAAAVVAADGDEWDRLSAAYATDSKTGTALRATTCASPVAKPWRCPASPAAANSSPPTRPGLQNRRWDWLFPSRLANLLANLRVSS